jgi:hypothetical protein
VLLQRLPTKAPATESAGGAPFGARRGLSVARKKLVGISRALSSGQRYAKSKLFKELRAIEQIVAQKARYIFHCHENFTEYAYNVVFA